MPLKPTSKRKSRRRWLLPSFGLTSLFLLVVIVSIYMAIRQSHSGVHSKLRLADKQVQSAIGATKEILFDDASVGYRRIYADENGNVADRKALYTYMKQSVSEENTGSNFKYGGIWKGESKTERAAVLYGHLLGPSNATTTGSSFIPNAPAQLKLDVLVRCRSPWYIFAGKIKCEVNLEEGPLNQEFVDILTQRMAELEIPVSMMD